MKRALAGILVLVTALSLNVLSEQTLDSGKFFFQLQEDAGNEQFQFV